MERQLRMGGGIMNIENRQKYLFGGITKSIKKAVKGIAKGVKKVAKSDLGKAALTAAAFYYAPIAFGGTAGFGAGSTYGNFAKGLMSPNLIGPMTKAGGLGRSISSAITGKAGLGIMGSSALTGLFAGKSQEEIQQIQQDPAALRGYLRQYFTNLNPTESPEKISELVESNMVEYRSEGGRIGYAGGTEEIVQPPASMMVDTTTYNPIPEDADRQGAAEIAKVMMATRDLPREEGEIEDTETMSSREFMAKEYLMPKVKELVENFGMSEQEALEMIRDEMMKFVKPEMAYGGRINRAYGSDDLVEQASGMEGLDININPKGVKELDLRETGGFIPPVGVKEKADDIPAMLSNNEFVFTADAVRAAGGGSVNKGAQIMYDTMKKLENGGRV